MATVTARDFLRQNGFKVGNRGRFNQTMLQFLKDNGFSVDVPIAKTVNKPAKLATKEVEVAVKGNRAGKQKEVTDDNQWSAKPSNELPIVRGQNYAFAIDSMGCVISFITCSKCNQTISRCPDDMPAPPKYFNKMGTGWTVQLNKPETNVSSILSKHMT
jgi:hypothetical protein